MLRRRARASAVAVADAVAVAVVAVAAALCLRFLAFGFDPALNLLPRQHARHPGRPRDLRPCRGTPCTLPASRSGAAGVLMLLSRKHSSTRSQPRTWRTKRRAWSGRSRLAPAREITVPRRPPGIGFSLCLARLRGDTRGRSASPTGPTTLRDNGSGLTQQAAVVASTLRKTSSLAGRCRTVRSMNWNHEVRRGGRMSRQAGWTTAWCFGA